MKSEPIYPKETSVLLKKKKWYILTRDILRREGLSHVEVRIEPGASYHWPLPFWSNLAAKLGLMRRPQILGTAVTEANFATGKLVGQTIHLSVGSSYKEIMDTIVHEIAHIRVPHADHGDAWKKEYRILRKKYVIDPIVTSDNDQGARINLAGLPKEVLDAVFNKPEEVKVTLA